MMTNTLFRLSTSWLQKKARSLVYLQQHILKNFYTEQQPSKYIVEDLLDVKYKHFRHVLDRESEAFFDDEHMQCQKLELELYLDLMVEQNPEAEIPKTLSAMIWKVLLTTIDSDNERVLFLKKMLEHEMIQSENELIVENVHPNDRYICDHENHPIRRALLMQQLSNQWKGAQSIMHGRPVIVDLDYDIDDYEGCLTVQHIIYMYRNNCQHVAPCHLHFTSVGQSYLNRYLDTATRNHMVADFHDEHFLDLFPRNRLIYLAAEGPMMQPEELEKDAIFVIGGLGNIYPMNRSYIKAKTLQIPKGSFPLKKYVTFKSGTRRDLYLPVVLNILLDKFNNKSWKDVLNSRLPDHRFVKHTNIDGELPVNMTAKDNHKLYRRQKQQKFTIDKTLETLKKLS